MKCDIINDFISFDIMRLNKLENVNYEEESIFLMFDYKEILKWMDKIC